MSRTWTLPVVVDGDGLEAFVHNHPDPTIAAETLARCAAEIGPWYFFKVWSVCADAGSPDPSFADFVDVVAAQAFDPLPWREWDIPLRAAMAKYFKPAFDEYDYTRCAATTKKGRRCTNWKYGSRLCTVHENAA